MKKLFTLFVIVLGLSLSSFNTLNAQIDGVPSLPTIEYDHVFDIAPIPGSNQSVTVYVDEEVTLNYILHSWTMYPTIIGKKITFTFCYSEWIKSGSPQTLYSSIILSDRIVHILFRFQ